MSEFEDVDTAWLQDCTSPGKTLFTREPWIIAFLKGWFCVRIQSLLSALLQDVFLQVVARHSPGQVWGAGARGWLTNPSVTIALSSDFAHLC